MDIEQIIEASERAQVNQKKGWFFDSEEEWRELESGLSTFKTSASSVALMFEQHMLVTMMLAALRKIEREGKDTHGVPFYKPAMTIDQALERYVKLSRRDVMNRPSQLIEEWKEFGEQLRGLDSDKQVIADIRSLVALKIEGEA